MTEKKPIPVDPPPPERCRQIFRTSPNSPFIRCQNPAWRDGFCPKHHHDPITELVTIIGEIRTELVQIQADLYRLKQWYITNQPK